MRLILAYGFSITLLVLLAGTTVEISDRLKLSLASGRSKQMKRADLTRAEDGVSEWEKINALLLSPTDAAFEAARLLNLRAAESPTEDRVSLYCRSLHELGLGLKKEPFNGRLLVSWANTRQLLGNVDCGLDYTGGDYTAALHEALRTAPADMRVKYAAAVVYLYAGQAQEANRLFGQVLADDPSLSPELRSSIFGQITDLQSFNTVIPPRFPQILQFSEYLSENCTDGIHALTNGLRAEIAAAQLGALKESALAAASGEIPSALHLKRLISLSTVSAGESVRRAVDAGIGEIMGIKGDREVAEYYRSRSRLASLAMIRGTIPRDSRASKSPLTYWEENPVLAFDDNYRSVGFFLASEQTPVFIELSSESGAFYVNPSALKILVSEDNQEWVDLSAETKATPVNDGTHHLLSIKVPEEYHKYWKVNFASASKDHKLTGRLSSLLRAYGRTTRTATANESCL